MAHVARKGTTYGLRRLKQRPVTMQVNPGDFLGVPSASMPTDNGEWTIHANMASKRHGNKSSEPWGTEYE